MWTRFGRRRISDVKTKSVPTCGRTFIKGKKIQVDTEEGTATHRRCLSRRYGRRTFYADKTTPEQHGSVFRPDVEYSTPKQAWGIRNLPNRLNSSSLWECAAVEGRLLLQIANARRPSYA